MRTVATFMEALGVRLLNLPRICGMFTSCAAHCNASCGRSRIPRPATQWLNAHPIAIIAGFGSLISTSPKFNKCQSTVTKPGKRRVEPSSAQQAANAL